MAAAAPLQALAPLAPLVLPATTPTLQVVAPVSVSDLEPKPRRLRRCARAALPWARPPPPPPIWQQPHFWAAVGAAVAAVLLVRRLARRRRLKPADMARRLESSMAMPAVSATAPKVPEAPPAVAPATAPPPPAATPPPASPAPASTIAESAPAAAPPTPASPSTAPATTAPLPPPPPTPVPTPAPTASAPAKGAKRGGIASWLRGERKPTVPCLQDLLRPGASSEATDEACSQHPKLTAAVASALCLDLPPTAFEGVEGLTAMPASIPVAARTALLQAAVKSEAEKVGPKIAVQVSSMVAKSMVLTLIDRVMELDDKAERLDALKDVVLFVGSAEQLRTQLGPDIEMGPIQYEGSLRPGKLEELYGTFLDSCVEGQSKQTEALMNSMMGGGDPLAADFGDFETMQQQADQEEKQQKVLGSVLRLTEGKATRMYESRMKVVQQEQQKAMMESLKSFGM